MDILASLKAIAPQGNPDILKGIAGNWELLGQSDITPGNRTTMFLAQIAHESAGFRTTVEYASGAAYEGRKDLGNTKPGDGRRFRGSGLIQLTGRLNAERYGKLCGADFIAHPGLMREFPYALWTGCLYWANHDCNKLADKDDFVAITKKINGGTNGLDNRWWWLERVERILLP